MRFRSNTNVRRHYYFSYNYDCDLKLTQEQAVQVVMGMIKNSKKLSFKEGKLTWVHRSDGSGTKKPLLIQWKLFPQDGL